MERMATNELDVSITFYASHGGREAFGCSVHTNDFTKKVAQFKTINIH